MNRVLCPISLLATLLPATVAAMPNFPSQIQQHLGLETAPGCVLCHASDTGGGPVSQPFGQAMLAAGLTKAGGDSLTSALDKLEADGTDSNRDGIADITGLRDGSQPATDKPEVAQGCGGNRIAAPRGRLRWPAPLLAAITVVLLASRVVRRQT